MSLVYAIQWQLKPFSSGVFCRYWTDGLQAPSHAMVRAGVHVKIGVHSRMTFFSPAPTSSSASLFRRLFIA